MSSKCDAPVEKNSKLPEVDFLTRQKKGVAAKKLADHLEFEIFFW